MFVLNIIVLIFFQNTLNSLSTQFDSNCLIYICVHSSTVKTEKKYVTCKSQFDVIWINSKNQVLFISIQCSFIKANIKLGDFMHHSHSLLNWAWSESLSLTLFYYCQRAT